MFLFQSFNHCVIQTYKNIKLSSQNKIIKDEHEQTMLLHGVIWSTWTDEYLKWKPSDYNNTYMISIETYKIWQPAFALYNSARSNGWFIHMNGVPATISNTGRVFAAGTFTFYVTCQFDFTNFPYDEQVINFFVLFLHPNSSFF